MSERALRCSKASARRLGRPVASQQWAKGSSYDFCLNVAIFAVAFLSTKKDWYPKRPLFSQTKTYRLCATKISPKEDTLEQRGLKTPSVKQNNVRQVTALSEGESAVKTKLGNSNLGIATVKHF